ncbi:MAG: CHAT domain-containing protein, partial [Nitrospira sp.]|nr:CHAT domain-containing protein [Nitrospira sp.]
MAILDEVRKELRLLDQQISSAGENWFSFRKRADEVIKLCMQAASTASEPDKTRLWLCALQASDLSKNVKISNLSFTGGLSSEIYPLPVDINDVSGILMPQDIGHQDTDRDIPVWRRMYIIEPNGRQPIVSTPQYKPLAPDIGKELSNPPEKVEWKNLLAISFHLLGEDLLIFCLDNLQPFLDGYMNDYAFREERLPSDYSIPFEPILIRDIRKKLDYPIMDIQYALDAMDRPDATKYKSIQERFRTALGVLSMYFEVKKILEKFTQAGINTRKHVLLLIPDKNLNQIPFHLLYPLFEGPFYEHFAGFVYSWDLISFKWRHYRRHIYYRRRLGNNQCVFFAVPGPHGNKYLSSTVDELEELQKAFGKESVAVFGNEGPAEYRSTSDNFILHHCDAEWLIFSGHGCDFRQTVLLPSRLHQPFAEGKVPVPNFGLLFEDRIVSSIELIINEYWNFSRSRLVLLNSCLLAQLSGSENTHGIRTALYAKGATSVIGSLWPVYDPLCPVFIKAFLQAYQGYLFSWDSVPGNE